MLTVEKLKATQPGEIFASGEGIDDGKLFNIWGEGKNIQWVAVRGVGYHDRTIYYHLYDEEESNKAFDLVEILYHKKWDDIQISTHGDKLTNERTIRKLVHCSDEAFKLYRY